MFCKRIVDEVVGWMSLHGGLLRFLMTGSLEWILRGLHQAGVGSK